MLAGGKTSNLVKHFVKQKSWGCAVFDSPKFVEPYIDHETSTTSSTPYPLIESKRLGIFFILDQFFFFFLLHTLDCALIQSHLQSRRELKDYFWTFGIQKWDLYSLTFINLTAVVNRGVDLHCWLFMFYNVYCRLELERTKSLIVSGEFSERLTWIQTHRHTHPTFVLWRASLLQLAVSDKHFHK